MQALGFALSTMVLFSCQKDLSGNEAKTSDEQVSNQMENAKGETKTKTYYGHPVQLGKGIGRTWVTVNSQGTPVSLGIDLSANSVLSQGAEGADYVFQLPKQVAVPPYDHIELGWTPHGHPGDMYMLPHFDLHYYMISSTEQATIPFLPPPAFDIPLPAKYLAPGYFLSPGLVPNMGAHNLDALAPEFNGGIFTKTFIYGSYKGYLTFLEPMFTIAYLNSLVSTPGTAAPTMIRQPQAFQKAGYYPTSYTISYDRSPKEFTISLNNLVYHQAQ
jgi:hypothetical protein